MLTVNDREKLSDEKIKLDVSELEDLFAAVAAPPKTDGATGESNVPAAAKKPQAVHILDPRKVNNIGTAIC